MSTHTPRRPHRWIAALSLLALMASACSEPAGGDVLGGDAATDPDVELAEGDSPSDEVAGAEDDEPDDTADDGAEAPELADQVEAGDLPPLDERLPDQPIVIEPVEEIGTYGGTWNQAMLGFTDSASIQNVVGYEPLVRWSPDWNEDVIEGVAHTWSANDDATEFTFELREGMRWSDGEPYTAEDIQFAVEGILLNEALTPAPPQWIRAPDGSLPELEVVSDHEVTFTYPDAHGLFLRELASDGNAGVLSRYPKHYLSTFHGDYNDDIDTVLEEEGVSEWTELIQQYGTSIEGTAHEARWANTELPTINAWMLTDPLGEGTQVVLERNPYYWKVDTEGNQLPYIDELVYDVVEEQEAIVLRAANGDIDFQERNLQDLGARSTLAENTESGGYQLYETTTTRQVHTNVHFNLNHADEAVREMFNDRDFRIAMSHALDREEINDLVYFGMSEPFQPAPMEDSRFYDEEYATQFTEFDPDLANEILDEARYEMGPDGVRLDPEGRPIDIEIAVTPQWRQEHVDVAELMVGYWQDVGVESHVATMDRPLHTQRRTGAEMDVHLFTGAGGLHDEIQRPRQYLPTATSDFAPLWAAWWRGDDDAGEAPPEDHPARRQFELYDELLRTGDTAEQDALFTEILQIGKEQFYQLGIGSEPNRTGVIVDNFRNVQTEYMFDSATFNQPGPLNPPQFFFDGEG